MTDDRPSSIPREPFVFTFGRHDRYDDSPIPLILEHEGFLLTYWDCEPVDTVESGRVILTYDVSHAVVTWEPLEDAVNRARASRKEPNNVVG